MILVTGGLGFVGSNTASALLEQGEQCVLTQHHSADVPESLQKEVGTRIFIERVDVTDIKALLAVGTKHKITGIVHLAGSLSHGADALEMFAGIQDSMAGVANVLQAAKQWGARRVTIASSIGIYNGISDTTWREDTPLPMTAAFPMEAMKKCNELLASYIARHTQVECVVARLAGVYGPLSRSGSWLPARLAQSAARGTTLDLSEIRFGTPYAEDGHDMCYVKDVARGLALLQTAAKLNHRVYNVASGRATSNQDLVDAIKKTVPEFGIKLPASPKPMPLAHQDITRLHKDTGYKPHYTTETAMADYIHWLRAGNEF